MACSSGSTSGSPCPQGVAPPPTCFGSGTPNPGDACTFLRADAGLVAPTGLAFDVCGALYVSDSFNHCIRKISPGRDGVVGDGDPAEEIITTFAGTCTLSGASGDGGPQLQALVQRVPVRAAAVSPEGHRRSR